MEESSFGVLPLEKSGTEWKIFLIKSKSGGYWGFPKGKPHANESPRQSAIRELKEETGLDLDSFLTEDPLVEKYTYSFKGRQIVKTVSYFPALVSGTVSLQLEEVQAGQWVTFDQAQQLLTYEEAQQILLLIRELLKDGN